MIELNPPDPPRPRNTAKFSWLKVIATAFGIVIVGLLFLLFKNPVVLLIAVGTWWSYTFLPWREVSEPTEVRDFLETLETTPGIELKAPEPTYTAEDKEAAKVFGQIEL